MSTMSTNPLATAPSVRRPINPAEFLKNRMEEEGKFPDPINMKFYVTGLQSSGKTSYASSIPDSYHCDPEDMRKFIVGGRSKAFVPKTGNDIMDCVDALVEDRCRTYKHFILDTCEKAVKMLIPALTERYNETHTRKLTDIREKGDKGSGWAVINEWVEMALARLSGAGYGWTVLGHVGVEERINPDGSKFHEYAPVINEGIRAVLTRDCHYQMYLKKMEGVQTRNILDAKGNVINTEAVKVPKVRLIMRPGDAGESAILQRLLKDKLGKYMPQFIDLPERGGYDSWSDVYRKACEQEKSSVLNPTV